MGTPGIPELLIILVIVVLLFGVGRVSKVGGELGKAVSNFRRGLRDGNQTDTAPAPSSEADNRNS